MNQDRKRGSLSSLNANKVGSSSLPSLVLQNLYGLVGVWVIQRGDLPPSLPPSISPKNPAAWPDKERRTQ